MAIQREEGTDVFTLIRRWLASPVFEGEEEKTSAASLLNPLLVSLLAVLVIAVIATPFLFAEQLGSLITLGVFFFLLVVSKFLMQRGHVRFASLLFVFGLWLACTAMILLSGGVFGSFLAFYIVLAVMAGLLLGRRMAVFLAIASSVAGLAVVLLDSSGNLPPLIFPQPAASRWVMLTIGLILVVTPLNLALRLLDQALGRSRRYASELEQQREHLEVTVEERTRELERRSRYLEATAEVAREASSVLDLEQLLPRVVALISDRFVLYRMGIFLLDPSGEEAVLRAASGEGGLQLLEHSFGVRVDGQGIVAHVMRSGQPYVAQDVARDPLYLDVREVADTQSELTLPLRARGEILGALSVQSPEVHAFSTDDVSTMQTLADQVALAISNAQLFQQTQESLEAERRAYGELSRQAWQDLLQTQLDLAIVRDNRGLFPLDVPPDAEVRQALRTGRSAVSGDGGADGDALGLAVPIRVRGQVIGAIDAHKQAGAEAWTPEQIVLLEQLSEQVGDALEDARLYQETQRRAVREQLVGEVTTRMRETLDVEMVLQTAVQEMRQALDLARVEARVDVAAEASGSDAPAAGLME